MSIHHCYSPIEYGKGGIPSGFTLRDKEILNRGRLADVGVFHANNIKDVALEDLSKRFLGSSLNHKTQKGNANVGVDGVGEGSIYRRSEVDLLEEILPGAGNSAGKARACRTVTLSELWETHLRPGSRSDDSQILGH